MKHYLESDESYLRNNHRTIQQRRSVPQTLAVAAEQTVAVSARVVGLDVETTAVLLLRDAVSVDKMAAIVMAVVERLDVRA